MNGDGILSEHSNLRRDPNSVYLRTDLKSPTSAQNVQTQVNFWSEWGALIDTASQNQLPYRINQAYFILVPFSSIAQILCAASNRKPIILVLFCWHRKSLLGVPHQEHSPPHNTNSSATFLLDQGVGSSL